MCCPFLIGPRTRTRSKYLAVHYPRRLWRRARNHTAIAAVDTARWDLKGQGGRPAAYQLLGGATLSAVRV